MTDESRIGECDACHARFKVPTSFRADRARCRECGGVVILERTHPVPRPPLEKSRKSKPMDRPRPSDLGARDERSVSGSSRVDAHEPQDHPSGHGNAVAPTATPRPSVAKPAQEKHTADKPASDKSRAAPTKPKKSGGVLGSIVAAAKAAVWRKKRDEAGSAD